MLNIRCSKIWCLSGVRKPSCSYIRNIATGCWAKRWDSVIKQIYDNKKSQLVDSWILPDIKIIFDFKMSFWAVPQSPQMLLLMALDEHNYLHKKLRAEGLMDFEGFHLNTKQKTTAPQSQAIPKVIRIYSLERQNLDLIPTVVQPCHSKQTNAGDRGKT